MSLVKKPEKTEAQRAARRANGRKSRGAKTPAGKERARAANLRHGYYSVIREDALVALGEDPARLRKLIDAAYEEWRPQGDYQSALVERTARLLWRMDRAERIQESLAVERVETLTEIKEELTGQVRQRRQEAMAILNRIYLLAGRPEFYVTPNLLRDFTQSMGRLRGSMARGILKLLLQLRKPAQFSQSATTLPKDEAVAEDDDWQDYRAAEAEEPVSDLDLPVPDQPVAEGDEREPLCLNLRDLADELEETFRCSREMRKAAGIVSDADRDVMWGKASQERALMRREEESCFREFWRLTKILTGMQARRQELRLNEQDSELRIANSRKQDSGGRIPDSAVGRGEPQPEAWSAAVLSRVRVAGGDTRAPMSKNAGASGDVHENKRSQIGEPAPELPAEQTKRPVIADRYQPPSPQLPSPSSLSPGRGKRGEGVIG